MARMRLNRFLAQCGIASRRNADKLIGEGRVRINGNVVQTAGCQVDSDVDKVEVDGKAIHLPVDFFYYLLNKPPGYDVTRRDRFAERTVYELLPPGVPDSVQAVGRLDRDTTGLLLLTNDGDLAYRLTHPRYEVEKEYLAFGESRPTKAQIAKILRGVELEDGPARANRAEVLSVEEARRLGLKNMMADGLRIVIHQGRKRIVRRLCAAVDLPLVLLHRVRIGPLELGTLKEGQCRKLTEREIAMLRAHTGLESGTGDE
jgi:pseudouridine synthase